MQRSPEPVRRFIRAAKVLTQLCILFIPEFLALLCAMGLLTMLPWVGWEILNDPKMNLSTIGALAVVYSAVGSLLLAGAGWTYVVRRLGAARAGVSMHLMPGIAVLLSMLFLGEYPSWYHGAGIALVLAGVALSTLRTAGTAQPASR